MRVVSLGFRCNNACVFCAQGELRATDADGSQAVDAEIAAVEPGEVVAFVGGEPTLHDKLLGWVRTADARGAKQLVVQTNGRRLAYRSYAKEIAAASSRVVLDVSLHGSTEAMHDYHTQAPGSFTQTVLGLRNAREEGLPAATTTVVTRSNYRHLADIVRLAHALGATAIHLAVAERFGRAARDASRVVPQAELVAPYVARALAEARRFGLGVVAPGEHAPNGTRERFAGIGEVERRAFEPSHQAPLVLPRVSAHGAAVSLKEVVR